MRTASRKRVVEGGLLPLRAKAVQRGRHDHHHERGMGEVEIDDGQPQ